MSYPLKPRALIINLITTEQAVLDTVRSASCEKKNENGLFASDLHSVHISRYAAEIVWYGHYRPSSAFKDITCDVHVRSFSGKVAAVDVYCWLHKAIFCAEEIILGIETTRYVSTLRSYTCLKCLILNVSFSFFIFCPLLTSDFIFSGTLTCAWSILIFSSKIMCSLFWFLMEWNWEAKANVESFRRRWGQH